jgi:hypothetical protein
VPPTGWYVLNMDVRAWRSAYDLGIMKGAFSRRLLLAGRAARSVSSCSTGTDGPCRGLRLRTVTVAGDHHVLAVPWKGGDRAPAGAAKARFLLRRAFLYGLAWRK